MDAPPVLPPPAFDVQQIRDAEHLKLLAIGYYIVGGLTVLFGFFGLIYVVFGALMLSGAFPGDAPRRPMHPPPPHFEPADPAATPGDSATADAPAVPGASPRPFAPDRQDARRRGGEPVPPVFGLFMMLFGGAFMVLGWTVGGLTIYAGRCLHKRRHKVFTLVMAGLNCLHMPFGTAMGVFTFIVLGRPTVEALYQSPGLARPHA